MVLDSASEISQPKPEGKGGEDPPFFFYGESERTCSRSIYGQTDMDETLFNLE
jgi:hypothetical protein